MTVARSIASRTRRYSGQPSAAAELFTLGFTVIKKLSLLCVLLYGPLSHADNVFVEPAKTPAGLEFHQASLNNRLGLPDKFHNCIRQAAVSMAKQSQCLISEAADQRIRLEKAYRALAELLSESGKADLKSAHDRWLQDVPNQCAVLAGFIGEGQDRLNRIGDCVVYEYAKRAVDYERYVTFKEAVILQQR